MKTKTLKQIFILILFTILINIVTATNGCNEPTLLTAGAAKNIIVGPTYNASSGNLLTAATCKITIKNSTATVVSQAAMTSSSDGFYNYSYTFTLADSYPWYANCTAGTEIPGFDSGCFVVSTSMDAQLSSIITNQNTAQNSLNTVVAGIQSNGTDIKVNVTTQLNTQNTQMTRIENGVINNATDIKVNVTTQLNSQNTQMTRIENGVQNNQTLISNAISSLATGVINNATWEALMCSNNVTAARNSINTGISSNTSFILTNTSQTTLVNLLSAMWSKAVGRLGFSFNLTQQYILDNASQTAAANTLTAAQIWQYRINTTSCDTNISANPLSIQACGELNYIYKYK